MSDLDQDLPHENNQGTLEDLMKAAAIADDLEVTKKVDATPSHDVGEKPASTKKKESDVIGDDLDATKEVVATPSDDLDEKPASTTKKDSDVSFVKPELLLSVYKFEGSDEFNKKDGSNKRGQQAACLKSLNKALSDGYCEIDLQHLRGWYSDLRFCALLDDVMEDALHMWHYRLIVINPHAMNLSPGTDMFKRVSKMLDLAKAFYNDSFEPRPVTQASIALAVRKSMTIMVVGKKVKKNTPFNNMWSQKSFVPVAAITFQSSVNPDDPTDVSAFVSWLVVSMKKDGVPSSIDGWRRQGFGLFMLIASIKICYKNYQTQQRKMSVILYLQSQEMASYQFYTNIGFQSLCGHFQDGFDKLPKHVQDLLWQPGQSKKDGECIFHFYKSKDENGKANEMLSSILMCLRYMTLRRFQAGTILDSEKALSIPAADMAEMTSARVPFWCKFPPGLINNDVRMQHTPQMMEKAFDQLPFVQALLPSPFAYVPSTSIGIVGDMDIIKRIEHTQNRGERWMAGGEVDLLLATMLFDGRYQDSCWIMRTTYSWYLDDAAEWYTKYHKALKHYDEAKENKIDPAVSDKEILALYGFSVNDLLDKYNTAMNQINRVVLHRNPGLLNRRLLIFPKNEGQSHWTCVFVFNPSFIDEQDDEEHYNACLRPCFFRYCSFHRYGTRNTSLDTGILWFLNQAYSYEKHEASGRDGVMPWHQPFGSAIDGYLLGSQRFPSLRFPFGTNFLPRQNDAYNCGIGVAATIAIILRDVVVKDLVSNTETVSYDDHFRAIKMELKNGKTNDDVPDEKNVLRLEEVYCDMPLVFFTTRLPSPVDMPFGGDYLTLLREQWFMLIDRLAADQHVHWPSRMYKGWVPSKFYTTNLEFIMQWPYTNLRGPKTRSQILSSPRKAETNKDRKLKMKQRSEAEDQDGLLASTAVVIPDSPDPVLSNKPKEDAVENFKIPRRKRGRPKKTLHQSVGGLQSESDPEFPADDGTVPKLKTEESTTVTQTQINSELTLAEKKDCGKKVRIEAPVSFQKKKLQTPTKRKLDYIEIQANEILKKIREQSEKDFKDLQGAQNPEPDDATQKFCTQSRKETEFFLQKFGQQFPCPEPLDPENYKQEKEEFIKHSFASWGWHTDEEHLQAIQDWTDKKQQTKSEQAKKTITTLIKAIKNERRKFRTRFAKEFQFNTKALVRGVKYDREKNVFRAELVWKEKMPLATTQMREEDDEAKDSKPKAKEDKNIFIEKTDEIEVNENWIKEAFGEETIQHVINMRQTKGFTQVPRDVNLYINKKKVLRVRYIAPQARSIVDTEALAKQVQLLLKEEKKKEEEEKRQRVKERRLPRAMTGPPQTPETPKLRPFKIVRASIGKTPPKVARKSLVDLFNNMDNEGEDKKDEKRIKEEMEEEDVPRKTILTADRWVGKMEDGGECTLEEDEVRRAFGDAFANEVKSMVRGFVDIPVGDCKPSHVIEHPNLRVIGAPAIEYHQTEGKDLCVSKSLASAFYNIGWHEQARKIDLYGETHLQGGAVEALKRIVEYSRDIFPKWILIERLPDDFDWRCDIRKHEVVVGVLLADDNNCSHAITIHDDFVFDANETIALPLCDEALNYCTSTAHAKSEFVRFKRGFRFYYNGFRKNRIRRMTFEKIE